MIKGGPLCHLNKAPSPPNAQHAIFAALKHYPRSTVAKDDILDAVVAAITASCSDKWATLPAQPEIDHVGLPMEMVYLN